MKLQEILQVLQGTEHEKVIGQVNSAVDTIKAKAVATSTTGTSETVKELQAKLKDKEEAFEELEAKHKPLAEAAKYKEDLKSFVEAGGKEDIDLSDFNYTKYKDKEGKVDWKQFLTKQSSLKKENEIKKDETLKAEKLEIADVKSEIEEMQKVDHLGNL